MKRSFLLFLSLFLLVIFHSAFGEENQEFSQSKKELTGSKKFDDILLVVHYNHAYFSTIPFLKELYSSFPNIVFYGEYPAPSLVSSAEPFLNEVILVPTYIGFFFSRVVADALVRFPNFKGYIFLQDDVMMNIWNFDRLDKDKIWFSPRCYFSHKTNPAFWDPAFCKKEASKEFFYASTDSWWCWFHRDCGPPSAQKVMPFLLGKDLFFMKANIGKIEPVGMMCDMFYLPKRYSADAFRLALLYQDVFCEIAIPTMLLSLDYLENWEFLKGVWGYNPNDEYPLNSDWVHFIKFSEYSNQVWAKKLMEVHLHE